MAFLGMRPHLARPLICFTVKGGLIDREQRSNYAEYTIYDFEIVYKMAHGYLDGILRDKIDYLLYMKSGNSNQFYANTQWLLEEMDNKTRNK